MMMVTLPGLATRPGSDPGIADRLEPSADGAAFAAVLAELPAPQDPARPIQEGGPVPDAAQAAMPALAMPVVTDGALPASAPALATPALATPVAANLAPIFPEPQDPAVPDDSFPDMAGPHADREHVPPASAVARISQPDLPWQSIGVSVKGDAPSLNSLTDDPGSHRLSDPPAVEPAARSPGPAVSDAPAHLPEPPERPAPRADGQPVIAAPLAAHSSPARASEDQFAQAGPPTGAIGPDPNMAPPPPFPGPGGTGPVADRVNRPAPTVRHAMTAPTPGKDNAAAPVLSGQKGQAWPTAPAADAASPLRDASTNRLPDPPAPNRPAAQAVTIAPDPAAVDAPAGRPLWTPDSNPAAPLPVAPRPAGAGMPILPTVADPAGRAPVSSGPAARADAQPVRQPAQAIPPHPVAEPSLPFLDRPQVTADAPKAVVRAMPQAEAPLPPPQPGRMPGADTPAATMVQKGAKPARIGPVSQGPAHDMPGNIGGLAPSAVSPPDPGGLQPLPPATRGAGATADLRPVISMRPENAAAAPADLSSLQPPEKALPTPIQSAAPTLGAPLPVPEPHTPRPDPTAAPEPAPVTRRHPQNMAAASIPPAPPLPPTQAIGPAPRQPAPAEAAPERITDGLPKPTPDRPAPAPSHPPPQSARPSPLPELVTFAAHPVPTEQPVTDHPPLRSNQKVAAAQPPPATPAAMPVQTMSAEGGLALPPLTDLQPLPAMPSADAAAPLSSLPAATPAAVSVPTTAAPPGVPLPSLPHVVAALVLDGRSGVTEVHLDPVELGPVQIAISGEGETLRITILAERPETLDLLRRNADQLLADLRQGGLAGGTIGFGGGGTGRGDHPPPPESAAPTTSPPHIHQPAAFSSVTWATGTAALNLRL